MKYKHHKYTWSNAFGNVKHTWEFVGPVGAVTFHVTMLEDKYGGASAGLEFHHRFPPKYMAGNAPSQLACRLTGGWCWHDGTSLYATESVWPRVKGYLARADHEAIFKVLEGEATEHFADGEEEEA